MRDNKNAFTTRKIKMSPKEYNTWKRFQMKNAGYWSIDPIHTGNNGKDLLIYVASPKDPSSGLYVHISNDGEFSAGNFVGAVPHMGEAEYFPKVTKKFDNKIFALSQACENYGLTFLKVLFRNNPPFRSANKGK